MPFIDTPLYHLTPPLEVILVIMLMNYILPKTNGLHFCCRLYAAYLHCAQSGELHKLIEVANNREKDTVHRFKVIKFGTNRKGICGMYVRMENPKTQCLRHLKVGHYMKIVKTQSS